MINEIYEFPVLYVYKYECSSVEEIRKLYVLVVFF